MTPDNAGPEPRRDGAQSDPQPPKFPSHLSGQNLAAAIGTFLLNPAYQGSPIGLFISPGPYFAFPLSQPDVLRPIFGAPVGEWLTRARRSPILGQRLMISTPGAPKRLFRCSLCGPFLFFSFVYPEGHLTQLLSVDTWIPLSFRILKALCFTSESRHATPTRQARVNRTSVPTPPELAPGALTVTIHFERSCPPRPYGR